MKHSLLVIPSALLFITACSGSQTAPFRDADKPSPAVRDVSITPNELARALIAKMPPLHAWHIAPPPTRSNSRRDETPQLNHILPPGFKGPRGPLFETHYWEGIFTNTSPPPPQQSGITSMMTAYSGYHVPAGYTYFAPDMNGPGNDCLETYIEYNYSSAPAFAVTNWCGGSGLSKTINSTFVNNYVTTYDGLPVVYASSTTDDTGPMLTWHVRLYNYKNSVWDDLLDQEGASGGGSGFSQFEVYRESAGCPSVPTILAADIKIYNAATGGYDHLKPLNSYQNTPGACFTNKNGYDFNILDANYVWEVTGGTPQ